MIIAQNLWDDRTWELPTDDDAWTWAQEMVPSVMLKNPKSTDDLMREVSKMQNYQMFRSDEPANDDTVVVPGVAGLMRAAKIFQQDRDHDDPQVRAARVLHEDDDEAVALAAAGVEVTEAHRRALRGLVAVRPAEKTEVPGIQAERLEAKRVSALTFGENWEDQPAQKVAQAVFRASQRGAVQPARLGGRHARHSYGAWLAYDADSRKEYFLKPGSGKQSPAAGVREETASQPRREVAAWHALDAMGLGTWAPRSELIVIDGREYAAEEWLGDDWAPAADADPTHLAHDGRNLLHDGQLHILAAALYVIGQTDGHGHNVLVKDKDLRLIDFGGALAGDGFDPQDPLTFVPFVLRFWAQGAFGQMTPEERLAKLPRLSARGERTVRSWIAKVSPTGLASALMPYGVMTGPSVRRLAALQAALPNALSGEFSDEDWRARGAPRDEGADLVVNRAWTVGL